MKNVSSLNNIYQIEKVNYETFLVGDNYGHLALINKKDFNSLSHLNFGKNMC